MSSSHDSTLSKPWSRARARAVEEALPILASFVAPAIVLGIALVAACLALLGDLASVSQRDDLDYIESYSAHVASHAGLEPAWRVGPALSPPHTLLPYPPGGYLIHAALGRITGKTEALGFRSVMRETTLAASLAAIVGVVALAMRLGARPHVALLFGLLLWCATPIQCFRVDPRPDALANLFTLLGWSLCFLAGRPGLGGIGLALAVTCKHSYLSAPLIAFAALCHRRDARSLVRFTAGGAATLVAVLALGRVLLGPHSLEGMLFQNMQDADPKQAIYFLGVALAALPGVFGLGLVAPLLRDDAREDEPDAGPLRVLWLVFLVSLGWNTLAMAKAGAMTNYLLEPATLGSVLAAVTFDRILRGTTKPRHTLALWLLVLVSILPGAIAASDDALHRWRDRPALQDDLARLRGRIDGPVLATDAAVYRALDQPYLNFPPDLTRTAFRSGRLDDRPVLGQIDRREFAAIILPTSWKSRRFLPDSWIDAVERRYEPSDEVGGMTVLLPRGDGHGGAGGSAERECHPRPFADEAPGATLSTGSSAHWGP